MKHKSAWFVLALSLVTYSVAGQQWKSLFNGKNLKGWHILNGKAKFQVRDKAIVGTTVAGEPNSFLVTDAVYEDFNLELEFKIGDTNSGIQVRSESKADYQQGRVHGYQVDFDPTPRAWTGGIYDEARRGWIYPLEYNPEAKAAVKPGDWNTCRVECVGSAIRVWINGVPTSSIVDDRTRSGFIALQVHAVGPPDVGKETQWRNIRINTKSPTLTPVSIFTADLVEAEKNRANNRGFWLEEKEKDHRVNVIYNGRLITSYCWYDSVMKPVLHPIYSTGGTRITREYPLAIVPGERADHPHQLGWFFTHESVNGLDFWNSSTAIPQKDRTRYGRIFHTRYLFGQGWLDGAHLMHQAQWRDPSGNTLLDETARFRFSVSGPDLVIDREEELKAVAELVTFKDAKDALLGLRVARELELPNQWEDVFVQKDGSLSPKMVNNEGATGQFTNSEGVQGEAIWGKKSRWILLTGTVSGRNVSLALIDHPGNLGYPVYWHARGYGLLSANPLGTSIFTNGKEALNYTLKKGESLRFRYRMVIRDGGWMTPEEVNKYELKR